MPHRATHAETKTDPARAPASAVQLWTGTGLCSEAQGDGVPCRCVGGDCECCARALSPSKRSD